MGRPESPLDAGEGPLQALALALRKLRVEAGSPTYRQMAARTGAGASTLSQAAAGERLPTLATVLAYASACGGDRQEWEQRWRQTARELAEQPPPGQDDADPPYRGLARFEPADRDLLFGRDALTAALTGKVLHHRLVAVVGASGSGKSSLLRAGLVPALQTGTPPHLRPAAIRILTPGTQPARHHNLLQPAEGEGDTVVIVDQFEELFTLGAQTSERTAFLDQLLAACTPQGRVRAVLAVRADFFGRCAEHPDLAAALQDGTVLAGPMSRTELREAVVGPAAAAGLIVERDLTHQILEDIADQPGGLPLLSHALLETWRRRRGRTLTLAMYQATGGIHGAITQTAEATYARLSPAQAAAARSILLRLVTPGDGVPDTRHPAPRIEIQGLPEADNALEQLARARLITLDDGTVDLAHEALLTAWPRYRTWIDQDRERLRTHRRLTQDARTWDTLGRDPGALYRGTRLTTAEEAFTDHEARATLTPLEHAFLEASAAHYDKEARAAARTTRRLRQLTTALSLLLAFAITASAIAWIQKQSSLQAQHKAVAAQRVALSRQLAAQSAQLRTGDHDLAALLAVSAYRTTHTEQALASLDAAADYPLEHRLVGHTGAVTTVAFSPDGHTLATGSDDHTVRLWSTVTGKMTAVLHYNSLVTALAYRDEHALAIAGEDGSVRWWDTATGRMHSAVAGKPHGTLASVWLGPSAHIAATTDASGVMRLWDTGTGRGRADVTGAKGDVVVAAAFSPDSRALAIATTDGHSVASTVQLGDAAGGRLQATPTIHVPGVMAMTFSPDSRILATRSREATCLWDTTTGRLRMQVDSTVGNPLAMAFTSDGRILATGEKNKTVRLWDASTGHLRTTLTGHAEMVTAIAFSPDGRTLASGSADNTVRLWDTAPRSAQSGIKLSAGSVTPVVFGLDGRVMATVGGDHSVRLSERASGRTLQTVAAHAVALAGSVAFSPDGTTLATGGSDGIVRLWDCSTGHLRAALHGHTGTVTAVAYSPDGRTLATAGDSVRLWDTATGTLRTTLKDISGAVLAIAFTADSQILATGGYDKTVRLWHVPSGRQHDTVSRAQLYDRPTAPQPVEGLLFSGDGTLLAIAEHDDIRIWDTAAHRLRFVVPDYALHPATLNFPLISDFAFSPNSKTMATGGEDQTVRLWDTATGQTITTLTSHTGSVNALAYSPDGRALATTGHDATVRLWDTADGELRAMATGPTAQLTSVTYSPDGNSLAATGDDHSVWLWTNPTPTPQQEINQICRTVHRDLTTTERQTYLPGNHTPVCPS